MYASATISGTFSMNWLVVTVSVKGRRSSISDRAVRAKLSSTLRTMARWSSCR